MFGILLNNLLILTYSLLIPPVLLSCMSCPKTFAID